MLARCPHMRLSCPTCSLPMECSDDLAGTKAFCPKCGQKMLLPTPPKPTPTNKTTLAVIEDENTAIPTVTPIPVAAHAPPSSNPAPIATVAPPADAELFAPPNEDELQKKKKRRQSSRHDNDDDDDFDDDGTYRVRCPYCGARGTPCYRDQWAGQTFLLIGLLGLWAFGIGLIFCIISIFLRETATYCSRCNSRL